MHYSAARGRLLRETFVIGALGFQPRAVVFTRRYVQRAGSKWDGYYGIPYHSYVIPENHELLDAIAFAYGDSISL